MIPPLDVAISLLATQLETAYKRLSREIGEGFDWTNLAVNYAPTIQDIYHFTYAFKTRSKANGDARGKTLAAYILAPNRIQRWVNDLDILFTGSHMILNRHLPLMIMYMDRYMNKDVGCVSMYKTRVDDVYKQFAILQQDAYLIWMEAVNIMGNEPGFLAEKYKEVVERQVIYKFVNFIPYIVSYICISTEESHKLRLLESKVFISL